MTLRGTREIFREGCELLGQRRSAEIFECSVDSIANMARPEFHEGRFQTDPLERTRLWLREQRVIGGQDGVRNGQDYARLVAHHTGGVYLDKETAARLGIGPEFMAQDHAVRLRRGESLATPQNLFPRQPWWKRALCWLRGR